MDKEVNTEGPVYSYEGDIAELDFFYITEELVDYIEDCVKNGGFDDYAFDAKDENGNGYSFECLGFSVMDRYGTERLYVAVKDLDEEQNVWRCAYIVQSAAEGWLLVCETDSLMFENFNEIINGLSQQGATEKKKKNGWSIALKIILFPFWLIWQFIKALLSLFNIAVGDSSAVKAFKNGYNGDDGEYEEYSFTNDMGTTQTVYSKNGRDFYYSDGSYAGKSSDGGKTIK